MLDLLSIFKSNPSVTVKSEEVEETGDAGIRMADGGRVHGTFEVTYTLDGKNPNMDVRDLLRGKMIDVLPNVVRRFRTDDVKKEAFGLALMKEIETGSNISGAGITIEKVSTSRIETCTADQKFDTGLPGVPSGSGFKPVRIVVPRFLTPHK